jgi:hypothetical protein
MAYNLENNVLIKKVTVFAMRRVMYDNIIASMILSYRYVIVNGIETVYLGRMHYMI